METQETSITDLLTPRPEPFPEHQPEPVPPANVNEIIAEGQPATPAPETIVVQPSELISDRQPAPIPQENVRPAQPANVPMKGKYRIKGVIYEIDWNKPNFEIAEQCNTSRQYVSTLRARYASSTIGKSRGRPRALIEESESFPIDSPPQEITETDTAPNFDDIIQPPEQASVDYKVLSNTVFTMGTSTLAMIFGPEWHPKNEQEREAVCMALENYMRSQQMKDLPPGVILAFVCCGYAAPRFAEPPTKAKLQLGWTWIKSKWSSWRAKRASRRKPELAIVPKPRPNDTASQTVTGP